MPEKLDATDALAVAVCHFFQGNTTASSGSYPGWSGFLKDHPERLKK